MIFITGATSFIGRNLLERLEKLRISSICLIRREEDKKKFKELKLPLFVVGNLSSDSIIKKSIKRYDIVIHLANITDASNPDLYYINIEGTRSLIKSCKEKKIKKFIYLSSANVNKINKDRYDKSKVIAEKIVTNSGLPYAIIRPNVIYGKYDYKNIFLVIQEIKNKKFKIAFNGEKNIQPVYVKDIIDIIENNLNYKNNKILDFSTPPIDNKEFLETIKKVFEFNVKYIFLPSILKRTLLKLLGKRINSEVLQFSLEKLKEELKHNPTSFEKGLIEYKEVLKK